MPDACAPRTPDVPQHDSNTSTFSYRFRSLVFNRPARGVKPASRYFYPHRNRDDARRCKLELYRVLAFRSAAASAYGGDDCYLFHRHFCRGGCGWPRIGHCRLPALSDNERGSIRSAQRMTVKGKETGNAQRSTRNALFSTCSELDVGRFPSAK
jgi:hypothetical protein